MRTAALILIALLAILVVGLSYVDVDQQTLENIH